MCEHCQRQRDDVKWLALLIRQGLKLIVSGIERRYGLRDQQDGPRRRRAA